MHLKYRSVPELSTEYCKRHRLNMQCKVRNIEYIRFAMKKPNQRIQIDILGPFYFKSITQKNYFINRFVSVTIYNIYFV